jgi:hypothetical protein
MQHTIKWIEGYEGLYDIKSDGTIRSYHKSATNPSIVVTPADGRGYIHVNLCKDGKRKNFWLHRLVASHFIPNPKNRAEVNHIDGNKSNVDVSNLEWVTRSQNIQHAYEKGLIPTIGQRGGKNPNSNLTDAKVLAIRALYAERELSQEEIGKMFGITKQTAYRIIRRKSWTHI